MTPEVRCNANAKMSNKKIKKSLALYFRRGDYKNERDSFFCEKVRLHLPIRRTLENLPLVKNFTLCAGNPHKKPLFFVVAKFTKKLLQRLFLLLQLVTLKRCHFGGTMVK